MVRVGAGASREAFHATRCAAKLRRNGRGRDLELLQGFDGRSGLIECGAAVGPSRAGAVQNHFVSKILPAAQLGFKDTIAAVIASRPCCTGCEKNKGLRRAQDTLATKRQRE